MAQTLIQPTKVSGSLKPTFSRPASASLPKLTPPRRLHPHCLAATADHSEALKPTRISPPTSPPPPTHGSSPYQIQLQQEAQALDIRDGCLGGAEAADATEEGQVGRGRRRQEDQIGRVRVDGTVRGRVPRGSA
jgi:hypothetical protein